MPELATSGNAFDKRRFSRRGFLGAGIASGFALAACASKPTASGAAGMTAAIDAAEAARPHSGRTVTATLTPQPARIDLGGPIVSTLTYGNTIPGPLIRATVGDEIVVSVTNRLGDPTSVHWHGIALRNDMDGTEPATANIGPGGDFTYRFSVPDPGTYWAHPHVGLQGDHGLYLPVVVDDPTEPGHYDAEWIIILDDWTDGIGKSPQQLYGELTDPNKPTMQNTTGMPKAKALTATCSAATEGTSPTRTI